MTEDGSLPIGGGTVSQLQSQEQADLLDAIDQLRRENIDAEIGIPQIVVCGDQSSGKSSLLEAIARVPFPAGSGAVTMFATELVLRRAPDNAIYASILPSWSRTTEQRDKIAEFQYRPEKLDHDEFKNLYTAASAHLRELDQERGFWYDKLRIEVSGPTQPHLTLIDLPGLIRTTTGTQSPGDVDAIYELTRSYLLKARTIVLAVVSATSDFQVQSVGNLMRSPDIAQRMMGVITKPDRALSQDDALKMIELASNEDLKLGLGWHVVKNLSHKETDRSPKHRDQKEHEFLTSSVWSQLPATNLGIEPLRQKLCQRLFESIKRDLPDLIKEMSDQLATTRRSIEQLGRVRKNAKDCLWYLGEIKRSMHQLTSAASDGVYDDPNFAVFFGKGDFTKLRNLITTRSGHFNRTIRGTGKTFTVMFSFVFGKLTTDSAGFKSTIPIFQPPYYSSRPDEGPCQITINSYCELLSAAMTQNRGKNLPDMPNYRDIQAVFRSQSIRWHSLATAHVELCYDDTLRFMSEATLHVAGKHTSSRLLEEYIRPSLERRRASLIEKLDELLWPFTQCHPMTAHPEYMAMPRLLLGPKDETQKGATEAGAAWTSYAQKNRFSIDHIHAAHVLDRAEAYYEIALDTFVDNIATLAIERILLRDLTDLTFANCEPSNLSDEELESVAGESTEVKEQRSTAVLKTAALEAVIKTCRQYKGISQSTPQKSMPEPSNGAAAASVTDPYSPDSEEHEEDNDTGHRSPKRAKILFELSTKTHQGADGTTKPAPESPTTPKPSQVKPQGRKPSPSLSSAVSSGFGSAKSNGSGSTPLSSPGSSGNGQRLSNSTGSIAYRSASRKKHVAVPHLDSD